MDPTTASYYRAILFRDSQDTRALPPTLVTLHAWAFKCCQAMGIGSIISKQAALSVAMTWLSTTKEGQAFTRESTTLGDLFGAPDEMPPEVAGASSVDWDAVPAESKVVVIVDEKPTIGEFIARRGAWIDVRVGGDPKHFRTSQVQLAGA
jgi:hypothetical protein